MKNTFLNLSTYFISTAVGIFLLAGCSKGSDAPVANQAKSTNTYVEGEIIVKTGDATALAKIQSEFASVKAIDQKHNVYLAKGKIGRGGEASLASEIASRNGIEYAQPNYMHFIAAPIPRVSKWLELWAMQNIGQDAPGGTEGKQGADIKAPEAWEITKGSKDIIVAVLDSGVDYTHPNLKENMWVNQAEAKGTPGIDSDGNGYANDVYGWNFFSAFEEKPYHNQLGTPDPMDDHGHGTHVSGIIGSVATAGVGTIGVNWNVRIMALKFLSASGSGSSIDAYRGILYAADNGADVINASWGGGPREPFMEDALKYAGSKGVLFVAAAGNDGADNDAEPHYPCGYNATLDNVMSVAATDNRDQLATFSDYGYKSVDIAAPGVGITSTYPVALAEKSSDPAPYRSWSGTSMATPFVSGAAALVLSVHPELRKHPALLKQRLLESADWLPHLAGKIASGGRLNLYKAVKGEKGNSPLLGTQWIEEPFNLSTPRLPTETVNEAWPIKKEGAKTLQLHIKHATIDEPYDTAILFDSIYRPIASIPAHINDFWLPAVVGDTAFLKFSNGLVATQKYLGVKVVDDPSAYPGSLCMKGEGSMFNCYVMAEPSKPFANFNSEGVEIDRIRYQLQN